MDHWALNFSGILGYIVLSIFLISAMDSGY